MNTKEQAFDLVNKTCEYYKIELTQLQRNHKSSTHKICVNKEGQIVRLSEIRMALSYFLYKYCPITLTEITPLVGYKDHTTMSSYRKVIEHYIRMEDINFFPYYLKIIDLASDCGIRMDVERISTKANRMMFRNLKGFVVSL